MQGNNISRVIIPLLSTLCLAGFVGASAASADVGPIAPTVEAPTAKAPAAIESPTEGEIDLDLDEVSPIEEFNGCMMGCYRDYFECSKNDGSDCETSLESCLSLC